MHDKDMSDSKNSCNSTWGGRFSQSPAEDAALFSESQSFDRALYRQDIKASKAHAAMLGACGIISAEESREINDGLDHILEEMDRGDFRWRQELEDVHMNVESRLVELIGDSGKKLHTARSRNDQVGLAHRMFVADCMEDWARACARLCWRLCDIAKANTRTIMPGLTHFQPAQPVTLAQHLLAYAWMFRRDCARLDDAIGRARISPLGAAALAGTTYPVDPMMVARAVGFRGIYANSMDAVSDRDFVLEALFCASLIAMHLSRLCEELIIWANPAMGFISLPDAFSTGSSIMPQKKNPDIAELMRGKTGRVYGALMAMLVTMKSLPLAYNRDMQEDKEGFLDASRTIAASLRLMASMLAEIGFNADPMAAACKNGYLNATELADYLAAKGVPFRDAHHITGKAVAFAEAGRKPLEELTLEEFRAFDKRIDDDIYRALDYQACIERRENPGGTGPLSTARQIEDMEAWLADRCQTGETGPDAHEKSR